MYILGDASGSIPVFYSFHEGKLVCGTNQFEVAKRCVYTADYRLLAIRRGSLLEQAMPGDVTVFKEVCVLSTAFPQLEVRTKNLDLELRGRGIGKIDDVLILSCIPAPPSG